MRYLHDLESGAALGTCYRRATKIEKERLAAQASAFYAKFGFGHCD
jgi:hypothetical protein